MNPLAPPGSTTGVVSSIPTGDNSIFAGAFLKPLNVNFVQKCQKCQAFDANKILH